MACSKRHNEFFSVSRDRSIKRWDIFSLRNVSSEAHAHKDWITCCLIGGGLTTDKKGKKKLDRRNTERFLFTGGKDCSIRVWDLETLECLDILTGHKGPISDLVIVNEFLFSASYDRTVRVWKIEY